MLSVNTNAGALRALQNLNATSGLLDRTQGRINTGLKVASAKDNAAVYAIAQSMRGNLAGLSAVQGSLDRAISTLDVAIAGGEAISDLLIEMKELAVAAADPGLDAGSKNSLNTNFIALRSQIDSIANNASFGGTNLLLGDTLSAITDSGATSAMTISETFGDLSLSGLGLSAVGLNGTGEPPAGATLINPGIGNNFTSNANSIAALNAYVSSNFPSLTGAEYNTSNGSFPSHAAALAVASALSFDSGATIVSDNVLPDWLYVQSGSLYLSNTSGSYRFYTASGGEVGGSSGLASEAVEKVDSALDTVNTALSKLGSMAKRLEIQKTFTGALADGIDVGIGNLVDADLARESALLQAFQTKQQLGLQALGIANQAPQSVLGLFR